MPGKVLRILKNHLENVIENETILVLEAMKMELPIKANKTGKLSLKMKLAQQVAIGEILFSIE